MINQMMYDILKRKVLSGQITVDAIVNVEYRTAIQNDADVIAYLAPKTEE